MAPEGTGEPDPSKICLCGDSPLAGEAGYDSGFTKNILQTTERAHRPGRHSVMHVSDVLQLL